MDPNPVGSRLFGQSGSNLLLRKPKSEHSVPIVVFVNDGLKFLLKFLIVVLHPFNGHTMKVLFTIYFYLAFWSDPDLGQYIGFDATFRYFVSKKYMILKENLADCTRIRIFSFGNHGSRVLKIPDPHQRI